MTTIFLIFGLIIGSFINAVVYRLRMAESLWDRSHCVSCKKKVRWHDNIPLLSFVLLSARCRDCGEKISWMYPTVEFLTGVVFALVGNFFFSLENPLTYLPTFFYLAIFTILIIIFVYDLKYMEIPMAILWLGVALTISYFFALEWRTLGNFQSFLASDLFSGILAGSLAFLFFFCLAYFSKETWMGYGDAYIGFLAGLIVGWADILWALILSFAIGAIFGIALIAFKKKTMKSQVPFAPFLVLGIFLAVFLPKIFPELDFFMFYF